MEDAQRTTVVILATHPLLGEGLARLLGQQPELTIVHVDRHDTAAAEAALSSSPDVVIVERDDVLIASDLLRFAPDALLIDVGIDVDGAFSLQRQKIPSQPDGILDAIRKMSRTAVKAAPAGALAAAVLTAGAIAGRSA
jgi:DNA-binding NarL/FixJ family response regulator